MKRLAGNSYEVRSVCGFSVFIMRRRGIKVEKGGWEKGTRERERERESAIKVNGRSQEHATFTHRVHLNVCITSSRVYSRIFRRDYRRWLDCSLTKPDDFSLFATQ